ncbi:MAG: dTMP kinase [Nitrospirae bacterium]|uniref:dTMP kinase n=1 Tax=Candidatus Magnetobacterium casense TaxID=1455061 RepID=UPI00058C4B68|nr:dTMP kinase [Candidatus Magnetobacterium casensis]MBF0338678.1 dTMP kinase [Nitrospirota bacterium]
MLVSFEGIDGCGKSTQVHAVSRRLAQSGHECVTTFEPGATRTGARIRQLLLDVCLDNMAPLTELLLFNAQRVQHIEEVIRPALSRKKIVLVDRFTDSTIAYQGFGRGIDLSLIETLRRLTTNIAPDITFLLDIDAAEGVRRTAALNKTDRMESEALDFYERVRVGFLEIAAMEPQRVVTLQGAAPPQELTETIMAMIIDRLAR